MKFVDRGWRRKRKTKLHLWVCLEREIVIRKKCIFGIKVSASSYRKKFSII